MNSKMTGLTAPDIYCTEHSMKENLLSETVKDRPLLIYRYTHKSCNTCYIEELKALQKEFSGRFDLVRVLCSYQTERNLLVYKRTYKIKLSMYNIPVDAFDWAAEDSDKPYYFVLHPNMKISNIYVPDKGYPELNKQYLEGVKRFLSDDSK